MKKIFFILVLAIGSMSFTSLSEVNNDLTLSESIIQLENLEGEMTGRCRWRVCTYMNGNLTHCTEWTYGECLDEVII